MTSITQGGAYHYATGGAQILRGSESAARIRSNGCLSPFALMSVANAQMSAQPEKHERGDG